DFVSTLDKSKILKANDIWLVSADVEGFYTAVDIGVERGSLMTLGTML
ncbi:MAG: hypothetical protein JWR35_3847, partial [Marmoricola sp.]|nr:hypothetical protein [Marmoricola sp.]